MNRIEEEVTDIQREPPRWDDECREETTAPSASFVPSRDLSPLEPSGVCLQAMSFVEEPLDILQPRLDEKHLLTEGSWVFVRQGSGKGTH